MYENTCSGFKKTKKPMARESDIMFLSPTFERKEQIILSSL